MTSPPISAGPGRGEEGRTIVEALLLGIVLLVPVVWLLTALADVHRAALGTSAAAREAAFAAGRAVSAATARSAVDVTTAGALSDHRLELARANVSWRAPHEWPRGGEVAVQVSYSVPLIRWALLGPALPEVTVRSTAAARIDPYRSR